MQPYIVDYELTPDGRKINRNLPKSLGQPISAETADVIMAGMKQVVVSGTGAKANIDGIDVYAKTGTAENPSGDDHSWIIGFAEKDETKIAFSIILENAGSGKATELLGEILKQYFE